MRFTLAVLVGLLLLNPGASQAQAVPRVVRPPRPDASRIFIDVSFAGHSKGLSGSREFMSRFVRFAEVGSMGATYAAPQQNLSPLVDLAGSFMLTRFLGIGAGYNRVTYENDVALSATIPHPTFFEAPASNSGVTGRPLARVDAATNVFVTLMLIRGNRLQVRILAGPSLYSYRADMVQNVSYAQTAAALTPQNAITIDGFTSARAKGGGVGVHAGGDVAYFFSKLFGVTAGVRFSQALVTLDKEPLSGVRQQIRVGGTLGFIGVRVRVGG